MESGALERSAREGVLVIHIHGFVGFDPFATEVLDAVGHY